MRRLARAACALLLLCSPLWAQFDFVITTIAGSSYAFQGDGGPALNAQLSQMYHVLCDAQGNLLVADRTNHQVLRITPAGTLHVIAGNGISGLSGDGGPATRASVSFPNSLALDAQGNLYVGDAGNYRIRRIGRDGVIRTIAGTGIRGNAGDGGPALAAQFDDIRGVAVDAAGNVYVSDLAANRIRRISPDGNISNYAGTGQAGFGGDNGPASVAQFNEPWHLSFDNEGNLLVADTRNHRLRRISRQGQITTVAGRGVAISDGDGGQAAQAGLTSPTSAYMDAAGNLYIAEFLSRIRVVAPNGVIRTFAGSDARGFRGDGGPASLAILNVPISVAGDRAGNIYIGDSVNVRIRRVDASGTIRTFAGTGQFRFSGDGGPAVAATFASPYGMATDALGNVYIGDAENHRVRRIAPDGRITTIAGTGLAGFSGDGGPATQAALNYPTGLAVDLQNNLYIADLLNQRVRRVTTAGTISTVAGGGLLPTPPDGSQATAADISPLGLTLDPDGNLYILDSSTCVILRVTPAGILSRFAGRYLECGSAGDGGQARNATLQTLGSFVGGITYDPFDGSLYLAEPNPPAGAPAPAGGRVRKINRDGTIVPFAGNGRQGIPFDGASAANSPLFAPESIAPAGQGVIFIGDGVFVYGVVGGLIIRFAGDLSGEGSGDGGPATEASFLGVRGLAFDRDGNLVFADTANYRVRAILANPPGAGVSRETIRLSAASGGAVTAPESFEVIATIPGVAIAIDAPADAPWLRVTPVRGATPRRIEVSADPAGVAPGTYRATLIVRTPFAAPPVRAVAVLFDVTPAAPPRLELDKSSFSFPFVRDGAPRSETLIARNAGGGALDIAAEVSQTGGRSWLSISSASGRATPGQPFPFTVTADVAGLAPGTYTGRITVRGGGATIGVPVTITVSANERAIVLSQTGLAFTAVAGGGLVPSRKFEVINAGRGSVSWNAGTSTLSGGAGWLIVTPASGVAVASSAEVPSVEVSIRQAGLAPGVYYGLVRVDAPGAANSPQVLTVFLEVLPAGNDPGPVVEPSELVFTGSAGRSPGSQDVFVYNIAQAAKTYRSTATITGAALVNLPGDATLDPARPNRVIVQPFVAALPAGVHQGALNLQFSDGRVRVVRVRLILTAAVAGTSGRAAEGCTPTRLVPAVTSLAPSIPVTVGWPVPVIAEVRDDCGDPHDDGAVVVSFNNGDLPIALASLKGGRWSGTWPARGSGSEENATLKLEAVNPQRSLAGQETLIVGVRARQDPPVVESAGVVSAAGQQSYVALAPGSMITVYGERLSEASEGASSLPLPTQMGSTRLTMGGRELPLLYVSPGQINALVPHDIEPNTRHQLLVRRANTYGRPVPLDVGPAQPAIFLAGARQGHVYWVRDSGSAIAAPATPARAGDVVVIYAAGLGATSPAVPAGAAAPGSPVAGVIDEVRVTVGGVDAPVLFAGLAPGFAGLYQLNVRIPSGVAQGDAVEVAVSVSGQTSPAATVAVQ